jgi:hypothetical protein
MTACRCSNSSLISLRKSRPEVLSASAWLQLHVARQLPMSALFFATICSVA